MNLLCRLGFHRWRYHGLPPERRSCLGCLIRQHLVTMGSMDAWVPTKAKYRER